MWQFRDNVENRGDNFIHLFLIAVFEQSCGLVYTTAHKGGVYTGYMSDYDSETHLQTWEDEWAAWRNVIITC